MNTPKYITRITRLSILPENEPIFSEQCTHITIADEAAGEYLEITQQSNSADIKEQTVMITPDEWPAIKSAVDQMMVELK